MPEHLTYDECSSLLNGIGLSSVPCWIRPVKTLSNGQRARAEAILLMSRSITKDDIVFIDEWTSVVDRTVAKAMSVCLYKFAKRHNKKVVILSCHFDILEWVKPNWVIDCNKQEFLLPKSESFFFTEREKLTFTIREIDKGSWKYFSKYHYLNERLPGGRIFTYGIFHGEDQIGFQCFANYVPIKEGHLNIYHSNRTIIHPDYNGLGLGILLINKTSQMMYEKFNGQVSIKAKFSSTPVFKAMIKDKSWKFIKELRTMGALKCGNSQKFGRSVRQTKGQKTGFREGGIKTYHFDFIPNKIII